MSGPGLKEIAERAMAMLLQAYRDQELDRYLYDALGIKAKIGILPDGVTIEEITITRTVGGPNTYVIISCDEVRAEVYWGSKTYTERYRGREVAEIFSELSEIVKELLGSAILARVEGRR